MIQDEIILETDEVRELSSRGEARLRELEDSLGVQVFIRGNVLRIIGDEAAVARAHQSINTLLSIMRGRNSVLDEREFDVLTQSLGKSENGEELKAVQNDRLYFPNRRKTVSPMTPGPILVRPAVQIAPPPCRPSYSVRFPLFPPTPEASARTPAAPGRAPDRAGHGSKASGQAGAPRWRDSP